MVKARLRLWAFLTLRCHVMIIVGLHNRLKNLCATDVGMADSRPLFRKNLTSMRIRCRIHVGRSRAAGASRTGPANRR